MNGQRLAVLPFSGLAGITWSEHVANHLIYRGFDVIAPQTLAMVPAESSRSVSRRTAGAGRGESSAAAI